MAAGVLTPKLSPFVRGVLQAIPESALGAEEIRIQYRQAGICLQGLGAWGNGEMRGVADGVVIALFD